MEDLESINSEWIKLKLEENNLKNAELAETLKVNPTQVSQWLTGTRNPSSSMKRAMYFYFKSIELQNLKDRRDVLKLRNRTFLPVQVGGTNKQYVVLWDHYDLNLSIVRSDIKEMKYIDLRAYKYLVTDPDEENHSVLYEIIIDEDLRLRRIKDSSHSREFEVKYEY